MDVSLNGFRDTKCPVSLGDIYERLLRATKQTCMTRQLCYLSNRSHTIFASVGCPLCDSGSAEALYLVSRSVFFVTFSDNKRIVQSPRYILLLLHVLKVSLLLSPSLLITQHPPAGVSFTNELFHRLHMLRETLLP